MYDAMMVMVMMMMVRALMVAIVGTDDYVSAALAMCGSPQASLVLEVQSLSWGTWLSYLQSIQSRVICKDKLLYLVTKRR